nr:HNH endonuclease signature motif containing protein [Arthrobacter sp. SDTb3-6]
MKEFLRLQYQRCASPYCDAPIRNYDHIKSWAAGGTTSIPNGQGLCAACNQAKEAPGWTVAPTIGPPAGEGPLPGKAPPGSAPPGTTTTTPTGHSYTAVAPALPGTSRRKRRRRRRRRS